eukprot:3570551-Pyramimonas_sp.AAC.1
MWDVAAGGRDDGGVVQQCWVCNASAISGADETGDDADQPRQCCMCLLTMHRSCGGKLNDHMNAAGVMPAEADDVVTWCTDVFGDGDLVKFCSPCASWIV